MIARLLLLLLVYKTTRCDEVPATKTTLFVPVISQKCKNIKCSTQEDPRCVKIKNEIDGNAIFIIVLNKCEIQYMECVNGFDAKVVSMKYCGHQNLTMTAKSNSTGNSGKRRPQQRSIGHGRVKRGARPRRLKRGVRHRRFRRGARKQGLVLPTRSPLVLDKKRLMLSTRSPLDGEKDDRGDLRIEYYSESEPDPYYQYFYSDYDTLKGPPLNRPLAALQKAKGDADKPIVLVGEAPSHTHGKPLEVGLNSRPTKNKDVYGAMQSSEDEPNRYIPSKKINKESFPLFSKEAIDEHGKNQNADSADGNMDQCPSSCPARVQMVCGKCQHGIYKTFMSSCHMRMFSCKYSAESMELVSRYPCILSAPYIAQDGVLERSKVVDGTEGDQVLSFIKCRSLGLLRTNDPRCPF